MNWMVIGKLVVWALVGAFAGSLASRLVTRQRAGYGRWTNLLIGMLGAVIGGWLFGLLGLDFGLGRITVSVADLIAAFAGIVVWAWSGRNRKAFDEAAQLPFADAANEGKRHE